SGRHHAPHDLLGVQRTADGACFRAYLPATRTAALADGRALERAAGTDFFEITAAQIPDHPHLTWVDDHGHRHQRVDPYSFAPSLAGPDLALFASGGHVEAWKMLGAHAATFDGVAGVRFAVWA